MAGMFCVSGFALLSLCLFFFFSGCIFVLTFQALIKKNNDLCRHHLE